MLYKRESFSLVIYSTCLRDACWQKSVNIIGGKLFETFFEKVLRWKRAFKIVHLKTVLNWGLNEHEMQVGGRISVWESCKGKMCCLC